MAGMILNYSKSTYEQKIARMEGLATELQGHLSTLESYKNQLKTFWNDVQGEEYLKIITDQIIKVRDTIEQVNRLKYTYSGIIGELTSKSAAVDGLIQDVSLATKTVIGLK